MSWFRNTCLSPELWVELNQFLGKPLDEWKCFNSWKSHLGYELQNFRKVSWIDSNGVESCSTLVTNSQTFHCSEIVLPPKNCSDVSQIDANLIGEKCQTGLSSNSCAFLPNSCSNFKFCQHAHPSFHMDAVNIYWLNVIARRCGRYYNNDHLTCFREIRRWKPMFHKNEFIRQSSSLEVHVSLLCRVSRILIRK